MKILYLEYLNISQSSITLAWDIDRNAVHLRMKVWYTLDFLTCIKIKKSPFLSKNPTPTKEWTYEKNTLFRTILKDFINQYHAHDSQWIQRKRKLGTWQLVQFLVQCVGFQNSSYQEALSVLSMNQKYSSKSAICIARQKVGWDFLRKVLHCLASDIGSQSNSKFLWKGHNIFSIDGSKLNLPKELWSIKYRKPNKGSYIHRAWWVLFFTWS